VGETFAGKSWNQWIDEYGQSHKHPINRFCHSIGIPLIAVSMALAAVSLAAKALWIPAMAMFIAGWALQFIGHAFERKLPEFFRDWRFLFVGVRWWLMKMRGHAPK
jgi:uncharacterized membrane protein YGL010W